MGQNSLISALFASLLFATGLLGQVGKVEQNSTTGEIITQLPPVFRASPGVTAAARTAAGKAKVVFIAARTDGRAGSGTEADPFDGSTAAKLDALIPTLPSGCIIQLEEGIFETGGVAVDYQLNVTLTSGVVVRGKTTLRGRGEDRTTLRLKANAIVAGAYNTSTTLQRRDIVVSDSDGAGAVVEHLAIDANRDNQSAFTANSANTLVYAVNLSGLDCAIRDVRVRGIWNFCAAAESFPVTISSNQGTWDRPAAGYIERVRFEDMEGYATALNLLGGYSAGSVTATGATFTANAHGLVSGQPVIITAGSGGSGLTQLRVYFARDITANTFGLAATVGGTAITLSSNLTGGSWVAFRPMTGAIRDCVILSKPSGGTYSSWQGIGAGGWKDVAIERNVIDGVFAGIFIDTPPVIGCIVRGNTIYARANPVGFAAFPIFFGGGYLYRDIVIERNNLKISSNAHAVRINGNVTDTRIEQNIIRDDYSPTPISTPAYAVVINSTGNARLRIEGNTIDQGNKTYGSQFFAYGAFGGASDANVVFAGANLRSTGAAVSMVVMGRNDVAVTGGTPSFSGLSVSAGDGTVSQSSLWADQDIVYINRTGAGQPFLNTEESIIDWNGGNGGGWTFHFNGVAMANKFLTTSGTGQVTPITLAAGQSVRLNAGGTALEAFTPPLASYDLTDGANIALLPTDNLFLGTSNAFTTRVGIYDAGNERTGFLTGTFTATRALTFPDADGTIALTSNLASYQPLDAALTALAAGSDFVQFTGPTTSTKVFTLPNASSTLLYSGGPLGTPSSATLTSATGLPLSTGVTGTLPAANGGAGTINGILRANGSGTVSAATAGTDFLAVSGAAAQTITLSLGANTAGAGLSLTNSTAASSGNQQYSPATVWTGQGWKTNATAASQSVGFRAYAEPVQGASAPTGLWRLQSSVNGGAYSSVFAVDDTGGIQAMASNAYHTIGNATGAQVNLAWDAGTGRMSVRAITTPNITFVLDSARTQMRSANALGWTDNNSSNAGTFDAGFVRDASGRIGVIKSATTTDYGDLRVRSIYTSTKTPASASDTGTTGEIAWDSSYIYVCVATNTWKRVAIATW